MGTVQHHIYQETQLVYGPQLEASVASAVRRGCDHVDPDQNRVSSSILLTLQCGI